MKKPLCTICLLLITLGVLVFLLSRHSSSIDLNTDELTVYCAAGLQKPVREIATRYEKEYGTRIRLNFAGSGVLESQIKVAGGDLFIPADSSYIENTRNNGWVNESVPLAQLRAVIVVRKGNPKNIQSMNDLARQGVRISVGEPSAAVGKYVRTVLRDSGDWEKIHPQIIVTKPTVNNVVEDVATGSVDAGLAWDAVAAQFDDVEIVRVPVFESRPRRASVGIIKGAKTPAALHFMRYLSSAGKGRDVFESMGFAPSEVSDAWEEVPELTLFSGSMLRPAIEERLRLFEKREGCRVNAVFEGCGALVAMMKDGDLKDGGAKPSAYFSCDSAFLNNVQAKFEPGVVITSNEIILLVPKGNPMRIRKLDDLSKIGLKVGLADAKKSALGRLSLNMMRRYGCWNDLNESGNIVVLASKGDELVNQMQSGALDAALLYRSNVLASPKMMATFEMVRLRQPDATALQSFAVAKETPFPQMVLRLRDFITNDVARERYEELGFIWKKPQSTDE